jgi:hypothetical protein
MSEERKERYCDNKQSLVWYAEQILKREREREEEKTAVVRINGTGYVRCSTYNSKFNFYPNRKSTIFHTV